MTRHRVLGVTKCPECRRSLEGKPIIVREVQEYPWRTSPSGHTYRSLSPVTVQQRWHEACWTRVVHDIERVRLAGEVQKWEDVVAVCDAAGTPTPSRVTANLGEARQALALFDDQGARTGSELASSGFESQRVYETDADKACHPGE